MANLTTSNALPSTTTFSSVSIVTRDWAKSPKTENFDHKWHRCFTSWNARCLTDTQLTQSKKSLQPWKIVQRMCPFLSRSTDSCKGMPAFQHQFPGCPVPVSKPATTISAYWLREGLSASQLVCHFFNYKYFLTLIRLKHCYTTTQPTNKCSEYGQNC